ncbi:MAG: CHASE3 domain-containing protein [Ferruginibacter sp.]
MKINIPKKILLISVLIMAALIIIGYSFNNINKNIVASGKWVNRTELIIAQSGKILSLCKDIEVAANGFVLTNDSTLLEPLEYGKSVLILIQSLRQLTADNRTQQHRIDSLNLYVHRSLNFSTEMVRLRSAAGLDSAIGFVSTRQGLRYIAGVRQITNAIQQEETSLLNLRKLSNERSVISSRRLSNTIFILLIIFAIVLMVLIRNYLLHSKVRELGAATLLIANEELAFQNVEKERKASELIVANSELAFQNIEKERKAKELVIANTELVFQNVEKENRAAELIIANTELAFQNVEKENRAAELIIANTELAFQNVEKENRAAELIIANTELAFQNVEKENRAAELIIANTELAFQNIEKETRAAELIIANTELAFQNVEKENRAAELIIANTELEFQNREKEHRARELKNAEEKVTKISYLYSFISQVNQNIVREKDESTLFSNSCIQAIRFGKFKMAWIGLFDDNNKIISMAAQDGIPTKYLGSFESISVHKNDPLDIVLRTGTYYIVNDLSNQKNVPGWGDFSRSYDINSWLIFPIKKSGKVIGVFNLYSSALSFSEVEEIALLVELTNDISFALELFDKIKQQRATEELILLNEKRFRAIIEKSADMKFLSTAGEELLYGSPSIMKVIGYAWKEFMDTSLFTIFHPDDLAEFIQKRNTILQAPGTSFYTLHRLKHKSGKWIWCEGTVTNLLAEPGVHALVSNLKDVSEKKIAEEQREFDRNNLKALINNTNDFMWSVNKKFELITSNQPFDDWATGTTPVSHIPVDENVAEFFPLMLTRNKTSYQRAFAGETFTDIEHETSPADFWCEISYHPIRQGGEVIGTACFSRNITEQKHAELHRMKISNELVRRNKDLEQFAYIISHNLRSPVANILGLSRAMNLPSLDIEKAKQVRGALNDSISRLDVVVTDLNAILQAKREISEIKEKVRFPELVENIKVSIKNLLESSNIKVSYDFAAVEEMFALKSYLHSIFYNLISNSIKYRRRNIEAVIEVSSKLVENNIELFFSDNGMGIDLKKKGDQVFGLYKRFHPDIEGKGIGLFMVKTQVETLGGNISIESEINKGTVFKIEFPI